MQTFLYEQSLSLYYKGKYCQIPNLCKSNKEIVILGKTYLYDEFEGLVKEDCNDNEQKSFSKSCIAKLQKDKNIKEGIYITNKLIFSKKKFISIIAFNKIITIYFFFHIFKLILTEKDIEVQKQHKKKSSGYFSYLIPLWSRKSNSDLSTSDLKFEKNLKAKNIQIEDQIFNIIWFSYRRNFSATLYKKITSDSGWGCMIRTGQMMLMNVLRRLSKQPFFTIIGIVIMLYIKLKRNTLLSVFHTKTN